MEQNVVTYRSNKLKKPATLPITVIIPAFNEQDTIKKTIDSLLNQTLPPEEIIVVDDHSSDQTGDIARSHGVKVLRPPSNTGSKAGAQNFALPEVKTKYTIAIDADTTLANNTLEKMYNFIENNPDVSACCNFVIPQRIKTVWERGRFIEYMFVFTFTKRVQDWYGKPLICSGCFSIYKTDLLKKMNGWGTRTMAEDMDLTWTLYANKNQVRFNTESFCYPLEPENIRMMTKQLKRWSHGWFQNILVHGNTIKHTPVLREQVIVGLTDGFLGSIMFLFLLPIIAITSNNYSILLLGWLFDALFISVPPIISGIKFKMLRKVISSLPSFFVLRTVNMYFFYEAFVSEVILKRRLVKYEKGH